jgi:glycosyltransferase involved in cell wall biosynthesis
MRIALDAYHGLYQCGGIARYTRSLISALSEISFTEEFILFYNRFREKGIAWKPKTDRCIVKQLYLPRRLLANMWRSISWPRIETLCGKIDIFHGLHFVLPPVRNARRILTVHDLTFLKFPDYFLNHGLNESGYKRELPMSLACADAVIAVSQKTREDLIEILKIPQEKIRVIYEGVDEQFFRRVEEKEKAAIRALYDLTSPYIVFLVGTPEPRKNLMKTVAAVRQAAPHLTLVLIGPQKPIKSLLNHDFHNLNFTDVVPEAHLPALLSCAQISLYPSLYEGFGLPVLESMACGTPVITSNRGALPEVAGDAAFYVDPEDLDSIAGAISKLISDDVLRNRFKIIGRKRAVEFTWKKAAETTISLYRELV